MNTKLRWVNGVAQLADGLTKSNFSAKKGLLEFLLSWSIVYDPSFTAGKKLGKVKLLKQLEAQQQAFVVSLQQFTLEGTFPWYLDVEEPEPYHEDLTAQNLRGMLGM